VRHTSRWFGTPLAALLALAACSQAPVKKPGSAEAKPINRTACTFDEGAFGSQRGVRAKQVVVDGKARGRPMVLWASPDWDRPQAISPKPSEPLPLAVRLAWRLQETEGAPESPLDGLDVRLPALASVPVDAQWRISIVDNEVHDEPAAGIKAGEPLVARFTAEGGGGIVLPGIIADSLGGINGGRFEIALVDANGSVIARRDVRPVRGYEFKALADKAVAGVMPMVANPANCTADGEA
jgi:hypothetical protein